MSKNEQLNKLKIIKRNEIFNKIKEIESFINRNNQTIERIVKNTLESNNTYNLTKLKKNNENFKLEIGELNSTLNSLSKHDLDDDLLKQINISKNVKKIKKDKEEKLDEETLNNKKKSISFFKNEKQSDRENNVEKEHERTLKYFYSVSDSLPDYMKDKLKKMPQNKGYIWRGVNFYGYLPYEDGKPITMFERINGVNYVHEYNNGKIVSNIIQKNKNDDDNDSISTKNSYNKKLLNTNNNYKKPYNNGDKKPYNNGDKKPYNNGDKKPYNNGDKKPYNNGDKKPYNNGDKNIIIKK
jgi:hypothetical protein